MVGSLILGFVLFAFVKPTNVKYIKSSVTDTTVLNIYIYIYIYICVCVCVCVKMLYH